MAEVMEMLALSPTMEEGTLAEWHKKEGDKVEAGEILAEVETDKATMEMESFYSGTILKLLAEGGQTVTVGAPLAIIGEPGEDISALLVKLGAGGASEAKEPEEKGPEEKGPEEKGPEEKGPEGEQGVELSAPVSAPARGEGGEERLKSSPLARRMAREEGIDITDLRGSGPGGRIIKRDIEQALSQPAAKAPSAASRAIAPAALGDVPGTEVKLSQMRKAIARRLVDVWQSTPHFYLSMSIDMARAMALRKELNAQLAAAGMDFKISVNDMIVKGCALALRAYPKMNVAYQGETVFAFDEVNIGVAVAVEDGLITPTIRRADEKSLGQIARETRELAGRARDKKLKPEEYAGHTFSISNLGMYGIDDFLAVINPPDSAILACGAVQQVPVVRDGALEVGTIMKVSLSCDHRAVDGAVGAEFLQQVKNLLENPAVMLV